MGRQICGGIAEVDRCTLVRANLSSVQVSGWSSHDDMVSTRFVVLALITDGRVAQGNFAPGLSQIRA